MACGVRVKHEFHPHPIRTAGFDKPVQLCVRCLVVRFKYRGAFHYYRNLGSGEHMGISSEEETAINDALVAASPSVSPVEADTQPSERAMLEAAREWIGSAPHGDNCFLHNDGGEYDACFCGKDSIENAIDSTLAASPSDTSQGVSEAAIRTVIHQLRTYNPAADAYKGKYIHRVWADELETALRSEPGEKS